MASAQTACFLYGVIEGFYGQPWTLPQRLKLFDWLQQWGLNTYMYGPKDDLKHRALWREPYTASECEGLKELVTGCRQRGLEFIYALSPGLDVRYTSEADRTTLLARIEQLFSLGCRRFALLFDDIPDRLDPEDLRRWGSLAGAQSQLVNSIVAAFRERSLEVGWLFCPTPYCERMVQAKHGGEGYLQTLGRELNPDIGVFWTGPEIISGEITAEHVTGVGNVLRRKPVLWDNLHANDYDGRRFYVGPYAGRERELLGLVGGILSNPNNEFPLNYVPVRTLGEFVKGEGKWDPRRAYWESMAGWLPSFETVRGKADLEELVLFGDCYYLPYQEGEEARALLENFEELLRSDPAQRRSKAIRFRAHAGRLKDFCARLSELRDRPLFYALSRRVWELREELDLVDRWLEATSRTKERGQTKVSDFHLPGTYRGGLVAKLQRLLVQHPDGSFTPDRGCMVKGPAGEVKTKADHE